MKEGQVFGRLTVLEVQINGRTTCRVKCQCGVLKTVSASNLLSGQTQSCGCLRLERIAQSNFKHGSTGTPTYLAWRSMIGNCYNPDTSSWIYVGYYGIKVCKRWRGNDGFQNFLKDMGERPSPKHRLSRLNKNRDFTPSNTYWATLDQCNRNRVNNTFYEVDGEKKCLVDWARLYNIPKSTLHYRVVTVGMKMKAALELGRGTCGKLLNV
jgi:hypothetical protein